MRGRLRKKKAKAVKRGRVVGRHNLLEMRLSRDQILNLIDVRLNLGPERKIDAHYYAPDAGSGETRLQLHYASEPVHDVYNLDAEKGPVYNSSIVVPELCTEAGIVHAVRNIMHRTAIHEQDEWLTLDGVRLFDPHEIPV